MATLATGRKHWVTRTILTICFVCMLGGCVISISKPRSLTEAEIESLNNPSPEIVKEVEGYLDEVEDLFSAAQMRGLESGRTLTKDEAAFASSLGIQNIEAIRVVVTTDFPFPTGNALAAELRHFGIDSWFNQGMTLGYTVFIKPRKQDNQDLLMHELVHVHQAETMGVREFMRQVLIAANVLDDWNAIPFEEEAYRLAPGE